MTPAKPAAKHKAPVYLTVERARKLLDTRRTETIDGKEYALIFGGLEEIMTPEENAEMLEIEQDLNMKRCTYFTLVMIACREHPAHAEPKAKGKKKAAEPKEKPQQEEGASLEQRWQPEDNHDPFAEESDTNK